MLFFLLCTSYICSQTPNAVHSKCGAALMWAEPRRAQALLGYRHGRQVVVCDRRVCGKDTQRASEVAPQLATETLNISALQHNTNPNRHMNSLCGRLLLMMLRVYAESVGNWQAKDRSGAIFIGCTIWEVNKRILAFMIVYDVQLKIHGNTYIPSTINTRIN